MRNWVNTLGVLLVACIIIFATSCRKKGCTDTDSTTYNASAKKDDGTCRYEGSNIFWVRDTNAQNMINAGIQILTVYVEGEIVGQINLAGQNLTKAPDCENPMGVTIDMDMFSVKSRAYSYTIIDDQSVKRRAGTFTMNGNQCDNYEIVFVP